MPQTSDATPSELSIPEFFGRYLKVLILFFIFGAVLGGGVWYLQRPVWTGNVTIQVGQLWTEGLARPFDVPGNMVDAVNHPSFRMKIAQTVNGANATPRLIEGKLVFDSLRGSVSKAPGTLYVQVSAHSRDQALKALRESFDTLSAMDGAAYKGAYTKWVGELSEINRQIAQNEAIVKSAGQSVDFGKREPVVRDVVAYNMIAVAGRELSNLRKEKAQIEDSMSPVRSYPTRMMGDAYVPAEPTSPSRSVFVIVGALAGIMAGLIVALILSSVRRRR